MNDEWKKLGGDAWLRLSTAGPSIFIDAYTDGIQTLSTDDAEELRDWLNGAIERMKEWEAQ